MDPTFIKSLLPITTEFVWLLTVNGEYIGYVKTRTDADLLLTNITKKLLVTVNNPKLEILNEFNRNILQRSKGFLFNSDECIYKIKIQPLEQFKKLFNIQRLIDIKKEDQISNWVIEKTFPVTRFHKKGLLTLEPQIYHRKTSI